MKPSTQSPGVLTASEPRHSNSACDLAQVSPVRVAMHTFGCRSNYADTVDIQAALLAHGASPCSVEDDADVYVLNSCTVTDAADKDLYKMVRKLRRQRPDAKILVTGCMAEAQAETLAEIKDIAEVIGPGRRQELLRGILTLAGGTDVVDEMQLESAKPTALSDNELVSLPSRSEVAVVHPNGRRVKKSLPRRHSISLSHPMPHTQTGPGGYMGTIANRARFHLRVQEGCENSCTFCIIPQTRGRLSSRSIDLVLEDLEQLCRVGYEEVVLTGTHLGGWGEDIGVSLADLLERLGRDAPIGRIRLSSIDPNDLGDSAINCLVKYPIFCNHLHICFQAFTARTLKRMNRKYSLDEAVDLLTALSSALPDYAFGSDVIAGFPGESREELAEGIELFHQLPISYLHVFPYSERSGTAATRLDGSVEPRERKRRAARWRAVAQRKKDAFLQRLVGHNLEVVCEKIVDGIAYGTSREYAPCVFSCTEGSVPRLGGRCSVRAKEYNLERGEITCELLNQVN